jgi:hypothetical protein
LVADINARKFRVFENSLCGHLHARIGIVGRWRKAKEWVNNLHDSLNFSIIMKL